MPPERLSKKFAAAARRQPPTRTSAVSKANQRHNEPRAPARRSTIMCRQSPRRTTPTGPQSSGLSSPKMNRVSPNNSDAITGTWANPHTLINARQLGLEVANNTRLPSNMMTATLIIQPAASIAVAITIPGGSAELPPSVTKMDESMSRTVTGRMCPRKLSARTAPKMPIA